MERIHKIGFVSIEQNLLIIEIDGKTYNFKINEISAKLSNATEKEKREFKISPSGYGIHWNLIDEDLSVNGLLGKV
jgi:hypothetical protein